MKTVVKRSVKIAGHITSVSLEDCFWRALKDIAIERETTRFGLVGEIDATRRHGNLSSAIRVFVFEHYRERAQRPAECIPVLEAAE